MKSFRENVIRFGSLFLIFLLPLLISAKLAFPFISIKTFSFYGITELVFSFWIYSLVVDKSYQLNKKQLLFFIPVILYITWLSLAGVLAVDPSLSFWGPLERGTGLLTWYHALIFSFIIVSLYNHDGKEYINKLLKSFLWGSFILALSVWFGNEGFNIASGVLQKSSGGGLIGNSSLAAPYLIFSLFICVYLFFDKQISRNWKIFVSFIFIIILFSPLFVNIVGLFSGNGILGSARGALLGASVGVLITILGYFSLSKSRIIKILGIIGIFVSILAFSIGWSQLMKPDTSLHNKFIESASGNRFIFWNIAQKSMDEHPYFGYGPENYMIAFRENFDIKIFDDKNSPEGWSDKAHNIYFDTGVASGYPGIAFYCIFLLSIFYGIYRAYKFNKISRLQVGALWGLLAGYIFQNLFVFDSPVSIVALFILASIVYTLQGDYLEKKYFKTSIFIVFRSILAVILAFMFIVSFIIFSYLPLKKSREFVRIMSLPAEVRAGSYMSLLSGSTAGNDWDASYFAYDLNLKYQVQIKNLQKNKEEKKIADADLTAYIKYLEKLSETNKTDYRLYLSMLNLYNIQMNITGKKYNSSELEHTLKIAEFAHKLSPRDPQVYWDTAFLKAYQGDINGAYLDYKKAVDLDKTSEVSWNMMFNFLKMTDSEELYNKNLKEAQKNIPGYKF